MKLFIALLAFTSFSAFAGKPVLYKIDDPGFDMGQMIKRCGKKLVKNDCKDTNGFKRKHAIYREIVINAPIDKVWDVIVDLKRYGNWNPFMPKLSAGFNVGEKIKFTVNMGPIKFWESLWTQAFEKNKR